MSLPSHTNNSNGQPSIRNFFRPKQPTSSAASLDPSDNPIDENPPSSSALPLLATGLTAPEPVTPATPATAHLATATPSSRPANLHPQASIDYVRPEHIPALRRITSLLLPVNYPDSFYARLADPLSSGAFSRVILWRDDNNNPLAAPQVIGGLVCRPEPSPFHGGSVDSPISQLVSTIPSTQPNALYIQSLVLLSPYRRLGLAAALLDEVIADAACSAFSCESVWAHVWTQNDDALRWYVARGFAQVDEVKSYYHKLQPDSAWIVRRQIGPGAALGLGQSGSDAAGHGEAYPRGPSSVTAAVANLPIQPVAGGGGLSSASSSQTNLSCPPLPAKSPSATRPPPAPLGGRTPGQSFQNTRPETEWNDLPSDMQVTRSRSSNLSVHDSGASSRSSSATGRKKRDRAYPAAAFGN